MVGQSRWRVTVQIDACPEALPYPALRTPTVTLSRPSPQMSLSLPLQKPAPILKAHLLLPPSPGPLWEEQTGEVRSYALGMDVKRHRKHCHTPYLQMWEVGKCCGIIVQQT